MDAQLGRQIGAAIASLDARLLEHTRASGKDRAITMQKLDDLRDHVEQRFNTITDAIKEVCDLREEEHGAFKEDIAALKAAQNERRAREEGRAQAWQSAKDAGKWTIEHGWKAILILYVGAQAAFPMIQQAFALPLHGLTQ